MGLEPLQTLVQSFSENQRSRAEGSTTPDVGKVHSARGADERVGRKRKLRALARFRDLLEPRRAPTEPV